MYRVESYESTCSATSSQIQDLHESKAEFEAASSIEDLQRLTIAFLRGERSATAYHLGPLLPESTPIVEKLVQINELGFITTGSQPGHPVQQRCYVEGVMKRSQLHLFIHDLYKVAGDQAFVSTTESELTWEEMKHLQFRDLYWVRKDDKRTGVMHITETSRPCGAFQTCSDVWPQLVDEYVSVFILDTVWGRNDWLLDQVITVLRKLKAENLQAIRRISNRST
jgi:hypothetical protein